MIRAYAEGWGHFQARLHGKDPDASPDDLPDVSPDDQALLSRVAGGMSPATLMEKSHHA
jgi:hypothetical protein